MIAIPTLTTHRQLRLGRRTRAFAKFLNERFLLELLIRNSPFSAELLEICDGPVQLVCRTSIQRDLAQTAQSAVAWEFDLPYLVVGETGALRVATKCGGGSV